MKSNNVTSTIVKLYRSIPIIRELVQLRTLLNKIWHLQQNSYAIQSTRLFDLELPSNPRYADPKRLIRFAFQIYSQHREDGMLCEIFRRIGIRDKIFLEIGVGDGIENNTTFLISQGWQGYWIDADDNFVQQLNAMPEYATSVKWIATKVSRENIEDHLKQMQIPHEFDLLSLDIDQNTYYVWEGITAYHPRVIVIEYNASLPAEIDWKVQYDPQKKWDGSANFGASLKALELLGAARGYSLVGCDLSGTNAFFVRNDLIQPGVFSEPFNAENHYEPARYILEQRSGHPRAIIDMPNTGHGGN